MSFLPFLGLVPLGPVNSTILDPLSSAIADFYPLQVRLLPAKPLPPHTYHAVRNQYHSTGLLAYLLNEDHDQPLRILGITAVDLYIPIFTFVFGEAQLDGRAALISTFRPGGGSGEIKPSSALVV